MSLTIPNTFVNRTTSISLSDLDDNFTYVADQIEAISGTVTGAQVIATNGIVVNSNTITTSYNIPSGSSAVSVGPITVAAGAVVNVPSGSRWVVL